MDIHLISFVVGGFLFCGGENSCGWRSVYLLLFSVALYIITHNLHLVASRIVSPSLSHRDSKNLDESSAQRSSFASVIISTIGVWKHYGDQAIDMIPITDEEVRL